MKTTILCIATLVSGPLFLRAEAPAPATITIDATSPAGTVNRLIFGDNINAADTARIFSSNTTSLDCIQTGGGFWDPDKKAPVPNVVAKFREGGVSLLRYPGGSLVHNYDWRKAVGTLEQRGIWKLGVDEYMTLCKALGEEPMFTMSDYVLPADQMPGLEAGLVEYLNAPATPAHPWAMKRKEWGHPEPYGVKWFELGNESDEGNMRVIPRRHYTPEEYAAYANATAAAMRAVDPTIKIGIVMEPGPGTDVNCNWDRTVARLAGKSADYLIVHLYGPSIAKRYSEADYYQGYMAAGEQVEKHLDEYRAMAQQECGRALPIAITEYNGDLSSDRAAWRRTYGVAFECADLLRIYLQPEHQVLAAAYWESLNGLFGMIESDRKAPDGGVITERPEFHLLHLLTAHLGTQLETVHVEGPRITFAGAGSVYPASGDTYVPARPLGAMATDGRFDFAQLKPGMTGEGGTGGAFAVNLVGVTGTTYSKLIELPKPNVAGACDYVVSLEARYVPDMGSTAPTLGFVVGDVRGWNSTGSAIEIKGIGTEWKKYGEPYQGLPDTAAISVQAHLQCGSEKVSGRIEVRGFQVQAITAPVYPAYPALTAMASLSGDGKTLHLIVFNKTADQDIPAGLHVEGFHPASASVTEVNGPGFNATDGVTETVQGAPLDVAAADPVHIFPAHSMTAIDFVAGSHP